MYYVRLAFIVGICFFERFSEFKSKIQKVRNKLNLIHKIQCDKIVKYL